MAQDYAQPHFEFEPPEALPPQEVKPFWRAYLPWFFYGCAIGIVCFGLFFAYQYATTASPATPSATHQSSLIAPRLAPSTTAQPSVYSKMTTSSRAPRVANEASAANVSASKSKKRGTRGQPTFDFYTILPEGEAGADASKPAPLPPSSAITTPASSTRAVATGSANAALSANNTDTPAASASTRAPAGATHASALPVSDANPAHATANPRQRYQQFRETRQAQHASQTTADKPVVSKRYAAQVASFRLYRDADEMRAQLLLQGFNATIQIVQDSAQQSWHRVVLGPYPDKRLAERNCARVQGLGYDCLVLLKS